jgi:sulfide:quinone oxidoreductase
VSVTITEGGADERRKVLIAGGGVAGAETLLALGAIAPSRFSIELIAPDPDLTYRPLSVAEPFGRAVTRRLPLAELAADRGAHYRCDGLERVDPAARVVHTSTGTALPYDFLVLAMGARASVALPGAVTFRGPADIVAFEQLLAGVEEGAVRRLAFAVPHGVAWPLPIYELALMTAAHLAAAGTPEAEITIVTPEREPLDIFGPAPSKRVRALAEEAGIRLLTSHAPSSVEPGSLVLMSGASVAADRVVALPMLDVPPIPGVPQGPRGFIPTDPSFRVDGLDGVHAAGDVTWYPIKQGGLAAQQADVVATAIAGAAGEPVRATPFHPVLRGILIAGERPLHMRRGDGFDPAAGSEPLWWPPGKVAGRYITPYLAERRGDPPHPPLAEIEHPVHDEEGVDQAGVLEMSLAAADSSASSEDYEGALRWLDAAEQLNVVLPIDYARRRRAWKRALAEQRLET